MDVNKKTTKPQTDDNQQEKIKASQEAENSKTTDESKLKTAGQETAETADAEKNAKGNFFSNIFSGKKEPGQEKQAASEDTDQDAKEKPADAKQELLDELAKTKEALLRSRADFDNYRKRIAREYQEVRNQAKINVINDFLPVYDYFQLAVTHAEQNADLNALKQGMQMILTEFKRAFDNLGAEEVNATGQDFDARWHEAVAQESNAEIPEGQVLQQWKCGFRMGDTLIRPATVVVSAGPEKQNVDEKQD